MNQNTKMRDFLCTARETRQDMLTDKQSNPRRLALRKRRNQRDQEECAIDSILGLFGGAVWPTNRAL